MVGVTILDEIVDQKPKDTETKLHERTAWVEAQEIFFHNDS